jgi:hypothetical protein
MKFRAHETFFIRKGWLNKGMKNIELEPSVFMGAKGNPMDILGIGSNMVKAMRYWMQAVGLSSEPRSGKREQHLTEFGELIHQHDPYIEEIGTLWLLHYKLVTNKELATAWYFFFNEFKLNEFTRDDFILHLSNYIKMQSDQSVSTRSLEDDYNCILNTYIPRGKLNPKKKDPESNIDCPLGELGLLDIVNKSKKIYRKIAPVKGTIHPLIIFGVIMDQNNGENEIKIETLLNANSNVGKIFNVDIFVLMQLLYRIESMGYIKVIRTAGLDVIRVVEQKTLLQCVEEYYQTINNYIEH